MPQFSLDDLVKPMTRTEVQASFYSAYAALGLKVSSWKPGAVVRTWTWVSSIVVASLSELQASIAKSGFLDLAVGPWLDIVAWHVYRQLRDDATFASGTVTLNNSGGGEYVLDPGDLIVSNAITNKQYRNTTAIVVAPLAVGVIVPIRAIEAGSASSAQANTITEFVTTLLQVTCTNTAALVGTDAESDDALRAKCRESLGALSPFGPWDAYASAVRRAKREDGSTLGVTRIRPTKDGYGNVNVYVATPTGGIDPADVAIALDAVRRDAEPLSVNASVISAEAFPIAVTYELWVYNTTGQDEAGIKAAVAARLLAFMQRQPIGGNRIDVGDTTGVVYRDAIQAEILAAFPLQAFHVAVPTPSGDTTLELDQVPALGTITATVHFVVPGEGVPS